MPYFLLRLFRVLLICGVLGFLMATALQMLNMVIAFPPAVSDFIAQPLLVILITIFIFLPKVWSVFGQINKKKKIPKSEM